MKNIFKSRFIVKAVVAMLVAATVTSFTGCSKKRDSSEEIDLDSYYSDFFDDYDNWDDSYSEPDQTEAVNEGICIDIFPFIEEHIHTKSGVAAPVSNGKITLTGGNGTGTLHIFFPADFSFEVDGFYFVKNFLHDFIIIKDNVEVGSVDINYSSYGLSNDEVISVFCDVNITNQSLMDGYYILPVKEYTVTGLGDFVDNYSQIPKSETERATAEVIDSLKGKNDTYTLETLYYGEAKPTTVVSDTSKIILVAVVSYIEYGFKYSEAYSINDLSLNDGKLTYSFSAEQYHALYSYPVEQCYPAYNLTEVSL